MSTGARLAHLDENDDKLPVLMHAARTAGTESCFVCLQAHPIVEHGEDSMEFECLADGSQGLKFQHTLVAHTAQM